MMKLRINPLVVADLKKIRNFIAEENVEKAVETINKIYGKFENIQLFPSMGADLSKRVSFRTDYKYAVWNDYVIIYKVVEEYVEIYRVLNRYQDVSRIFDWNNLWISYNKLDSLFRSYKIQHREMKRSILLGLQEDHIVPILTNLNNK